MPPRNAPSVCRFPSHAGRHPLAAALLLALGLGCGLGLGGCTARPLAVSMPMRPQPVLQSAGQWHVVADDVASAISAHLEEQMGRKVPVQVYMMRRSDTLFADAFISAVTTRLVQKGHAVAIDARPDVVAVGIDVLTVKTNGPRVSASPVPGPITLLAAGVGVASLLTGGDLAKFPWGISAGVAAAGWETLAGNRPPETDTEMILTVSIAQEGFFTFRTSAVYYVNAEDLAHYTGATGSGPGGFADLNTVSQGTVKYDLAGNPYIVR